jgi:membrane AbrB-like protein
MRDQVTRAGLRRHLGRGNVAVCATVLAACGLGDLLRMAGVPVASLFAGMGIGLAAALAPAVRLRLPRRLYALAQALLGAAIGTLAQVGISGSPSVLAALPLLIIATIALSLAAGATLARRTAVGHDTALLGMVAGGSAGVVAVADEVGADTRLVATMQYLRVAIVAATVPLVATLLQAHGRRHLMPDLPSANDNVTSLATVVALALAGMWLGRRVHLPAPALAGPLLLASMLGWIGLLPDVPAPHAVTIAALAIIGLEIGLRFDRAAIRALRRMAPIISALTAAMMAGCAGLGVLLSVLTGVPPVDAYLMTTPGGINAVLAAAISLKGVDLALVTLAQTLRLLAMVIVAPRLIRWLGPQGDP